MKSFSLVKAQCVKSLLLAVLIAASSLGMDAQIVDRTTDRAVDKTNNRLDQRIDQGIDKGLDSIEGIFKKKDKSSKDSKGSNEKKAASQSEQPAESPSSDAEAEAATMRAIQGMFGGSSVPLPDSYTFDHNVDMSVESFDKKGKSEGAQAMKMLFSDAQAIVGVQVTVEGMQSVNVIDVEKKIMVMLMDMGTSKMAMTLDLDQKWADVETDDTAYENPSFKKTGRTKTILGYKCDEYVMEEDGDRNEFWVTRDEFLDVYKAFGMMNASSPKGQSVVDHPGGMVMEMIGIAKNGERTEMRVTAVNKNQSRSISTKGYTPMGGM
ncbi:MAG: DUF4412 domain-containing protein [Flavobacteriales bacterium]